MFSSQSQSNTSSSLFGGSTNSPGGLFSPQTVLQQPVSTLFPTSSSNTSTTPKPSIFGTSTPTPSNPTSGGLFGSSSATNQPTTNPTTGTTGNLFGSNAPTSSASGTGLFGNTSTQPSATGGLFGASSNTPSQTTTSNLFGASTSTSTTTAPSTNITNQSTTGGLFGASNTTTQPAAGGLFGASNPTPSQPTNTGGLFGTSNTATSQPTNTGGLFGSSNNSQATNTGGLFGSNTSQPTNTGGLFGSSNNNTLTSQPSSSGSGLFGTTNNQTTNTGTGTGLFGSTSNDGGGLFGNKPNSNPTGGLFASTNNPQSQSLFGNSSSSLSTGNRNSSNLGVSNLQGGTGIGGNGSNLLRTTRFNDLPDEFKRQLESLDAMIQNQCRLADTIKSTELGKEINEGSSQLRQVKAELNGTSSLINESSIMLENLQKTLDQDISDILKIGTNLESLNNNPTKSNQEMNNLLKFQLDFFIKQTLKLNERIKVYEQTLESVECQLKGLNDRPNPASIVPAIKAQYSTFMVLADRVAKLDSRLRFIKDGFIEIWKLQTGSVKNPFLEIDLQNQNQNQNQKLLN